jgi:hypothetical protein
MLGKSVSSPGYSDKADKEIIILGLIERTKFTFNLLINLLRLKHN